MTPSCSGERLRRRLCWLFVQCWEHRQGLAKAPLSAQDCRPGTGNREHLRVVAPAQRTGIALQAPLPPSSQRRVVASPIVLATCETL